MVCRSSFCFDSVDWAAGRSSLSLSSGFSFFPSVDWVAERSSLSLSSGICFFPAAFSYSADCLCEIALDAIQVGYVIHIALRTRGLAINEGSVQIGHKIQQVGNAPIELLLSLFIEGFSVPFRSNHMEQGTTQEMQCNGTRPDINLRVVSGADSACFCGHNIGEYTLSGCGGHTNLGEFFSLMRRRRWFGGNQQQFKPKRILRQKNPFSKLSRLSRHAYTL